MINKKNNKQFYFKKSFGQNFLYDDEILQNIVSFSNITKDDFVIEIGAGSGNLTKYLSLNSKKVIAIELDDTLINYLNNIFYNTNVSIINKDFLKISANELFEIINSKQYNNEIIKVVSNIPYNITSLIINKLLSISYIKEMTLLLQKEVADRICAKKDTHDYGILTLAVKYYADTIPGFIVDKKCFKPIPKIDSKVIKIIKHNVQYDDTFTKKFFSIIKNSFSKRRKTLANSLSSSSIFTKQQVEEYLIKLNLNVLSRPEDLSFDDYIKLTKMIIQ